MFKRLKRFRVAILISILTLVLSACGFPGLGGSGADTIRIASQSTTEQQIMAYMLQDLIEHETKLKASLVNNLGSASVSFEAQKRGDADMTAIRYDGTDYAVILGKSANTDPNIVAKDVKSEFQKQYNMTYFPTYGFADTYVFMVRSEYAKKHNLKTVSDLKKLAPSMRVGIDQSWMNRKGDGYPAFKQKYGMSFGHVYPMQIGLVYDALNSGRMDAVLGYSTDGRIGSYDLKLLKDDRQFFPPYKASPVINDATLKAHPELTSLLNRLDNKISLKTMQELNYKVDDQLEEPQLVAQEFLQKHHYFKGGD